MPTREARSAIVTGASRGIGKATALELARRGYDVTLVATDKSALSLVGAEIEQLGLEAIVADGDLSDLQFAESVVQQTIAKFGRVDVLVNNAAWREVTTMRHISLESWERTLRICLTTPAFMSRWAAESMLERRRGVIVNVSSIMSQQAAGFSPAYVASKGALESLTFELAALYGPSGIRVVAVCPGAIDTDSSRDYTDASGDSLTEKLRAYTEDVIALRRWGTSEEIAKLIAFVASDEASYLTGTTITADGGWRHQHLPLSLRQAQFSAARPEAK